MVKISVIIPTWNRSELLVRAIQSVQRQTYCNIEIIIADNASGDNTQEVVKQFLADERIKYIRNSTNIGARGNFNQAMFEHASGDFVLILSDDDILTDDDFLKKAAEVIMLDSEIVLVSANFRYVNSINKTVMMTTNLSSPNTIVDGKWLWLNYNLCAWCPLLTTVFSRKHAIRLGGFFLEIPGIDMLLFLHLLLNGKAAILPDVVADYSIHQGNDSKSSLSKLDSAYENLDRIRVPARYALKKGIEKRIVSQWKERMMVQSLRQIIWDFCLEPSLHGDNEKMMQIWEFANRHGETEYLHKAMYAVISLFAKRLDLKNHYYKMDISL